MKINRSKDLSPSDEADVEGLEGLIPHGPDSCTSANPCKAFVRLEIVPEGGCFLSTTNDDMEVLAHTPQERGCSVVLKRDKGESGRIYLGSTIDVAACPLIVMKSFGILPSVVDTTQDGFIVDGYTNDEKSIWEMVSELREVTSEVKVQKVGSPSTSSCHDEYQGVNLDELTEKQREAVELAYENGYFDRPKNKTLEQISEELNISSQALSRRLGRVEKEIFTQLLRD